MQTVDSAINVATKASLASLDVHYVVQADDDYYGKYIVATEDEMNGFWAGTPDSAIMAVLIDGEQVD